jgi:hypothetical protein
MVWQCDDDAGTQQPTRAMYVVVLDGVLARLDHMVLCDYYQGSVAVNIIHVSI